MSDNEGQVGRPRPTMRDVAALAGVSVKSVSRVVNREGGVSDSIRQQVMRSVHQLEYRHNLAASNLRRGNSRTQVIGVLLQDVSNSFSAGLLRALDDAARQRGVAIFAASLDEEPERERALVADLVARRVDGLVLMPATDRHEYLLSERRAGLPIVFVDRTPRGIDADSVTVNNRYGGRLATAHLLSHGHRRIAFLGDLPAIHTAAERQRGYNDAFAEADIAPDPSLIATGCRTEAAAEAALAALFALSDPPTAIFAGRNVLSVMAVRALHRSGLARRIAVVGFDDFPLSDILEPALTVVRQDVTRVGSEASELLFRRIDGTDSSPQHIVVNPTLICRGSGEIHP
jgi:LacI family transcriptional regulator